jgi:2-polyprenyl-3-methyl-5-hydroxy-6-metoxy-1,4-benzoquinol methylase
MHDYTTRELVVGVGGHDYRIRALSDLHQFADPRHLAEHFGISSAMWGLFGQVWPSCRVMAEAMSAYEIAGKRILELGCGLGLSSLVLQRRLANVTASDHHPLAESFLRHNAMQNKMLAVVYRDLQWEIPDATLGCFDLIIGCDVLYESSHANQLAETVLRHAAPGAEILISDPGRGNSSIFTRIMADQGFAVTERRSRFHMRDVAPFRGKLLSYRKAA